MIRVPALVICLCSWMRIFAAGMMQCHPTDPYVEYSCFSGEDMQKYFHNKALAEDICTKIDCCWNSTIPRCYAKSQMAILSPNAPHQSTPLSQSNHYSQTGHVSQQQQQQQQQQHQDRDQQPYPTSNQQQNYNYNQQQNRYTYQSQNRRYRQQGRNTNSQRARPNYSRNTLNQIPKRPAASAYYKPPVREPSNVEKLLAALGMPPRQQQSDRRFDGQGVMGTSIAAAVPKQGNSAADSALSTIDRCSLANSLEEEAVRQTYQKLFKCTGNEPKIPREEAERLVQGLLGSGGTGGTSATPAPQVPKIPTPPPKVSPELTFPVLAPAKSVGGRLPSFGVQSYRAPPRNPRMCLILNSMTTDVAAVMKLRYQCGKTGNELIDLATGNSPKGLGSVPSIINLFGITKDAPSVSSIKEGSINPNRIPSEILSKCITNRYTYPSCRTGYDTNINTESECFNVGCLFFRDSYGTRCFRCDLVPAEAYRLQNSADTCSVGDKEPCAGFEAFQLTVASIDMRGRDSTFATTPAPNPFASLFGSNPALKAIIDSNPSLLNSISSNPLLSAFARSGTTRQLDTSTLLSFLSSGGSSANRNSLLLNALSGGRVPTSGTTGLLLNLLSGDKSGSGYSFPKLSKQAIASLKSTCETKGCCWTTEESNRLGGTCFKKGVTFPTSCLPTPDTGTCGKSLDTNDLQRVVGGVGISSATSRPWMAMIQEVSNGVSTFRCGGVQICSQWILTTASCLQRKDDLKNSFLRVPNVNPATIRVFVGTVTPALPGPELEVERIIVHPGYNTLQSYNDIALLRIRTLSFSASNGPVCLPPLKTAAPAADQVLYFTGYGKSSSTALPDFTSLKEIPMTVKSASDCNTVYPGTVLPQSGIFCATPGEGSDTCYGDGGGPIVKYDAVKNVFTLFGINFGGSDTCDGTKPSLFTSITNFMPWIAQSTNGCCNVPAYRNDV